MKLSARWLVVGGLASALVVWSLAASSTSAADEDKEAKDGVLKIAGMLEKKDADAAKKEADALAKKVEDMEPVMNLMSPVTDGGLGVAKPAAANPDGIEKKVQDMDKLPLTQKQVEQQSDALVQMAYEIAAIAKVAQQKCPVPAKQGAKDPKKWQGWSADLEKGALELAEAAKAKKADAVKKAVTTMSNTCANCHEVFK
jgi:hypothetical protein